jgi:hypothetical protein
MIGVVRESMLRQLRALLSGGNRRSIRRSDEVAGLVPKRSGLFPILVECLWDADPMVRARAADAAEKASRNNKSLLQSHKQELLRLLGEATQQELRWHLAVMIPRLPMPQRNASAPPVP